MNNIIYIENIDKYNIEIVNNTLILKLKDTIIYINEEELKKINITKSSIIECNIFNKNNNIVINKNKYLSILLDIWKSMPIQMILQNTTFNMKLSNENGKNGYYYDEDLKISIQHKDANNTFKEIIKMINLNKYNINITIKLENNEIINYKNY